MPIRQSEKSDVFRLHFKGLTDIYNPGSAEERLTLQLMIKIGPKKSLAIVNVLIVIDLFWL